MFTTKTLKYYEDDVDATAVVVLSQTNPHNFNTAHKTVMDIASRYIESVVYIDMFWIYITSFQVFFYRAADVDSSLFKFYERSTAFIQRKTTGFNTEYFEFVIYVGNLELVVTGGFFGEINQMSHRCFLGPIIINLTNDMKNLAFGSSHFINLLTKVPSFTTIMRISNQYGTVDSDRDWGLHSYNFMLKSYYHIDLLRLTGHSSRLARHSDTVLVIASMALQCFAIRSVTKNEVTRASRLIAIKESLCSISTSNNLTFNAFVGDDNSRKLNSYNQTVLKLCKKLEDAANRNKGTARLTVQEKYSILLLTKGKLREEMKKLHKQIV